MQHRAEREFKRHKEEIELLEMERRRQLDEDMRHREEVNKMKFKKEWEYIESEKRKLNKPASQPTSKQADNQNANRQTTKNQQASR